MSDTSIKTCLKNGTTLAITSDLGGDLKISRSAEFAPGQSALPAEVVVQGPRVGSGFTTADVIEPKTKMSADQAKNMINAALVCLGEDAPRIGVRLNRSIKGK